jgi:NurA-like 5'-3' nuclease
MNIRDFLDKVEKAVLKGIDEGQEVVEETVDNVKERWAEFQEDIKSVPSFRDCLATRMRINYIKEQSKGRRHKSQKQLRR